MIVEIPPIKSMSDAFSVKEKNVVVTGGHRGIGLGICTAFAQSGANVIILDLNTAKGAEVVKSFEQYGGRYACFAVDVSDLESCRIAAEEVYGFFDHVDVLINNAGVSCVTEFLKDKDLSEWHRVIDTDLHGVANMIYSIAPKMVDAGLGGRIINISSVGGQSVGGNAKLQPIPPYHAAKAGLNHFTHYLAIELGDAGIRVNAIAPGPIHSDLDHDLPQSFFAHIKNDLPTHRFGEALEIGAYCVYLASPAASQITGCVCVLDGGMLVWGS